MLNDHKAHKLMCLRLSTGCYVTMSHATWGARLHVYTTQVHVTRV